MKSNILFLDLDGVLVDFNVSYEGVVGIPPKDTNNKTWEKNWKIFVEGGGFENAPMLPGAAQFFSDVIILAKRVDYEVHILSAGGRNVKETYEEVKRQKIEWLVNRGMMSFIEEVVITPSSEDKILHSFPNRVLVDDHKKNITQFDIPGGIGILHEGDYSKTLEQLEEVFAYY